MTDIPPTIIDPRAALRKKEFISVDDLSRSEVDALYCGDITQYSKITKLTIQKFLEACLREDGQFRRECSLFASFVGDFNINQNFDRDSNRRMLQIASYYEQMKERPPNIFIQSRGYRYEPASLGGLTAGWNDHTRDGRQIARVYDSIPMTIDITCVAMDESTIEDLEGFLSYAFGWAQKFLTMWELRPSKAIAGAYWVVILPSVHEMGARANQSFQNDPKTQIFSVTCTLQVQFENSTYVYYNAAPTPIMGQQNFEITVPTKITLGSVVPIFLGGTVYPVNVHSSDPRIALIEQQHTTFFIRPQRVGRFTLVVTGPGSENDETTKVYAERELTVSLR
jgi:hypothetical protein